MIINSYFYIYSKLEECLQYILELFIIKDIVMFLKEIKLFQVRNYKVDIKVQVWFGIKFRKRSEFYVFET